MKNNFKRILAFVLGFLMFLFPAPRASAQIEVVEFSDQSRLIRFTKSDLQNMVDWYAARVVEHERSVENRDMVRRHNSVTCFGLGGICGLTGFILTVVGSIDGIYIEFFVPGLVCDVLAALGIMCACRLCACRYGNCCCDTAKPEDDDFGQVCIIRNRLIRNNVAAGADESQPLLRGGMQGAPGCFLLLERRKDKASTEPRPFFTTDRDTNFTQSLRNNRFAGLIRDVAGRLRARGARITKRYYLSKVGSGFAETSDPRVMPELDIVDVVVDDADEDAA